MSNSTEGDHPHVSTDYIPRCLTNSTRLDPVISTFRESLKAFYGSLHLVQNDVLQVEYAAEGGQRQHQGPAGEQHLGVPGDPVLSCAGRVERQAGIGRP